MTNQKQILTKFYIVLALLVLFVVAVGFKLLDIQFVNGKKYEEMAHKRVFRNFTIPANRGNLYDADNNLLATSVPKYDIHFDAVTVSQKDFDENLTPLVQNLSKLLGNSPKYYKDRLRNARQYGNRYMLIARDQGYSNYIKIKNFPLFKKGPYKGGFIAEQRTERERPLGKIAERTVGHGPVGMEGAYNEYLKGKDGHRLKQKIANGLWKPISDANEVEPKDGFDVISTININFQDIVHHALLKQLEKFKADHGVAIVMDVKTGEIKALANLGRTKSGNYYEKRNYAIWETQEPGSTFKLMTIVAALEDKVVDTAQVFDSENGTVKYYDSYVRDSHVGGYGKISAARAFEVSSNTVFSKIVTEGYKDNPEAFVDRLNYMGLGQKVGIEIRGEGQPKIPHPHDKSWSGVTLPWMSFGYGVLITPLQILTFYNAIANDGIEIKPRFIKEVRDRNRIIKAYDKEVNHSSICSKKTAKIAQTLMKDAVERGTARGVYSSQLSIAGKTGTALASYGVEKKYTGSFAGFFPVENPKYSCIVVVNDPDTRIGFYGAQVAAPAFKEIAEKIYNRVPETDSLDNIQINNSQVKNNYQQYYSTAIKYKTIMPNVVGMPAMDALALLENMGLKANIKGTGKIVQQSIPAGKRINEKSITLSTN